MLGIEASSSITNDTTSPIVGGASSARNTAAAMPSGTASSIASADVTSVPHR